MTISLPYTSYFNVGDKETIEGTEVTLASNDFLVVDAGGIPNGETSKYPGVEANKSFTLGVTEPDIDDCFVFPNSVKVPLDTRASPLRLCVSAYHPSTKYHLEVHSTEPAFQFYTGRFIDVEARSDGSPKRAARAGFCVEPSRYVDAVNNEAWKDQVILKKGQVYGSKIVYKSWKA